MTAKRTTKSRRGRVGRPSRAEATAKTFGALGVYPAAIDPKAVLRAIASDISAPATARVQACRALLADGTANPADPAAADAKAATDRAARVTKLALELLGGRQ